MGHLDEGLAHFFVQLRLNILKVLLFDLSILVDRDQNLVRLRHKVKQELSSLPEHLGVNL